MQLDLLEATKSRKKNKLQKKQ